MQAKEQDRSWIRTGVTGWISAHIENSGNDSAQQTPSMDASSHAPDNIHLFENMPATAPFPERFPRLTFFAIACGLLASAVMAEIECLKGSGYYWQ